MTIRWTYIVNALLGTEEDRGTSSSRVNDEEYGSSKVEMVHMRVDSSGVESGRP